MHFWCQLHKNEYFLIERNPKFYILNDLRRKCIMQASVQLFAAVMAIDKFWY
jgi:hypothetical protein